MKASYTIVLTMSELHEALTEYVTRLVGLHLKNKQITTITIDGADILSTFEEMQIQINSK